MCIMDVFHTIRLFYQVLPDAREKRFATHTYRYFDRSVSRPAPASCAAPRNGMDTIRVIVVDEQPLFRRGICSTLEQMGNCEIIGQSIDAMEILELARTGNPDVALIDAGLTAADPLEIARQMRHLAPQVAIMILTPSEDEERLFQAIKVGAAAYYTRNIEPSELADAVRRVSHGEYLINDDVLSTHQLASRVLKFFRELT